MCENKDQMMKVIKMLHLLQLEQTGFTFLTDGKIETEKYSDQLLELKKKRRILLVSFGTGQVTRILFPWDVEWLHMYSEIVFIVSGSSSEAYLTEGWCMGLWTSIGMEILVTSLPACPHSKHPSVHSSDALFHSIYFVKAKSFDQSVGGLCIFILLRS